LAVAVIVELVFVETTVVVTVKVAVVDPAATETVAGTVAALALEVSATEKPPAGAGLLRVTVPVDGLPPTTEVGLRATVVIVGAVMARDAVTGVAPLAEAPMLAVWFDPTAVVVTVNVAVVAPAATETDAGTVPAALLDVSATARPPVGAALLIVTVPVDGLPPTTEVGFRASVVTVGAVTARVAVLLTGV
jgi:hypothetical protein